MSLLSTNMAISETKSQGWRAIPTQRRKASNILTSTMAVFLFSSHPKKGKAHLDYYASAYDRGRTITLQDKSNTTKTIMHP